MPIAIAYGISEHIFFHSTPNRLKKIYKEIQIRKDYEMWQMGIYIMHSLESTVCNSFIWRNKGSEPHKYPNIPLYEEKLKNEENTEKNKVLTEDEKKQKTENLFMALQIMGVNHKMNKSTEGSE